MYFLLFVISLFAQDQDVQPIPAGGPLTDAIEKRFDGLRSRLQESEGFLSKLISEAEQRQDARQEARLSKVKEWIESLRVQPVDMKPIRDSIAQLIETVKQSRGKEATERNGFFSRVSESLAEARKERLADHEERLRIFNEDREERRVEREERRKQIAETMKQWTPVKDAIERLNSLLISILVTLGLLILIALIVSIVAYYIYSRFIKMAYPL